MQRTRLLVIGDEALPRSGLAALLARHPELEVVGEVTPREAEARAAEVDVAVWDAAAADAERFAATAAAVPVVALAAGEPEAAAALTAGARGVVLRDGGEERLVAAVVAAARGVVALDAALSAWIRPPLAAAGAGDHLTPRELEVLDLLAEGRSNRAIAQRLGVSERTAKFHVESILGKLRAATRSEAIVLAARRGLVTF